MQARSLEMLWTGVDWRGLVWIGHYLSTFRSQRAIPLLAIASAPAPCSRQAAIPFLFQLFSQKK